MLAKIVTALLIAIAMVTLANAVYGLIVWNVAACAMDLILCGVAIGAIYLLETMGETEQNSFLLEKV